MNNTLNSKENSVALRSGIAVLGAVAFGLIAWQVTAGNTTAFDTAVDQWFYSLRNGATKGILVPVTYLGNAASIVMIMLALLLIPKTRKPIGLPSAITGIVVLLIYKVLKNTFARPRPEEMWHIIEQGGFSFPSGHSLNGLVCYGMIIFCVRRCCRDRVTANWITGLLTLLIVLIGISRIFVGVHYVTDVLAGWSLGLCFLMIATICMDKLIYPKFPL